MNTEGRIDIHNVNTAYEIALKHFNEANISEKNKQLCLEFVNVMSLGWGGNQRVGKHRLIVLLNYLRENTKMLESLDPKLTWLYLQKSHSMQILLKIDNVETWGEWAVFRARQIMKQFMTWVRKEYRYPDGYPDSKKLNDFLPFIKVPIEVDYRTRHPRKIKDINDIPTEEEVNNLISIWDEQIKTSTHVFLLSAVRNQAIMAILAEVGIRIGGLGDLQIKNVSFDKLGARLTVVDKTMVGQPVRLVTSARYLKNWLELHPWKDNPDAPLWPVLQKARSKNIGDPLTYNALWCVIIYSRIYYNRYAKEKGLPLITRRLTPHGFRYYAQTRDMLDGMPISVQCVQRGWAVDSDRPQHYARITTGHVDKWLAEKYGLTQAIKEEPAILESIKEFTELKKNIPTVPSKTVKRSPGWHSKPRKEQLVHRQSTGISKLPAVNILAINKAKSCVTCTTKYPGCQNTCFNKPFLFPGN